MRTIVLGNAGAGKTTLVRKLINNEPAVRLSLDEIAFVEGAARRPLAESVADAKAFIEANDSWIIEGCYADILEPLLPYCEKLVFLNPGVETCVSHCKARPWEPEKFESSEAQDKNLENLIEWVRSYETRDDDYSLKRHRALYEAFSGEKYEFNDPSAYLIIPKFQP